MGSTRPLVRHDHENLLNFLGQGGEGFCHCQFWQARMPNEQWLARDPERNREDCAHGLEAGSLEGSIHVEDGTVVAWSRWARTADVPKLTDLGLEGPQPPPVLCFEVDERARNRGVARKLLDTTLDSLRGRGFVEVHAYPRADPRPEPGTAWTGPRRLFEAAGFERIREAEPRWTVALRL